MVENNRVFAAAEVVTPAFVAHCRNGVTDDRLDAAEKAVVDSVRNPNEARRVNDMLYDLIILWRARVDVLYAL